MKVSSRILTQGCLLSASLVLTGMTFFLGAIPLYGFRKAAGRLWFLLSLGSITAGLWVFGPKALAVAMLTQALLVEVFVEIDDRQRPISTTGMLAVMVTGLTLAGGVAFWIAHVGASWLHTLQKQVDAWIKPILAANPGLPLTTDEIIRQVPSATMIVLAFTLFFMLLFERWILALSGAPAQYREELREFRAPNWTVWILIASVLATFGQIGHEMVRTVGVNILNASIVCYFFQGLAVLVSYLRRMKVGLIWQALAIGLACIQLFLAVSLVGLIDYWVNFRERMKKTKTPELERET